MTSGLLTLETRKKIFEYVSAFPGAYLREIARSLHLSLGAVEYHLDRLTQGGLLSCRVHRAKKRYFVAAEVSYQDEVMIASLRQEVPRQILVHLLGNPGATFRSLLGIVPVSKSTLSFHMKRLVEAGLVKEDRAGREKRYQVERGEKAAELVTRMRGSLMDDAVDSFVESWMGL